MYLNGVMLISAVLEFGTLDFTPGNDLPFTLFLPSYAAVAHYHGLIPDRELAEVLADAERFAASTGTPMPLRRATGCPRTTGPRC